MWKFLTSYLRNVYPWKFKEIPWATKIFGFWNCSKYKKVFLLQANFHIGPLKKITCSFDNIRILLPDVFQRKQSGSIWKTVVALGKNCLYGWLFSSQFSLFFFTCFEWANACGKIPFLHNIEYFLKTKILYFDIFVTIWNNPLLLKRFL